MSKKIIIYGAGPLAELMHYHFTEESEYEVVAFCLDEAFITQATLCDLPIVPFETIETTHPEKEYDMFVAIGYSYMRNRKLMFDKAKVKNYTLVNFISPAAGIRDNLIIGENNLIQARVEIEPFAKIGNNNIFWTNSILGHHFTIGDHNYIAGSCGFGGYCTMGNCCFMGNAAVTANTVVIADETYMVAGAVILRDTEVASRYHGNPSKLISRHPDTGIIIL
ncbi:MAG: acetyltransferase [Methylococcales bacterium]|nr:acetyltransferase [Methylococcales bacterium]